MKITECFTCDLSKCDDCKYWIQDGYAYTKIKRANEAWNHYHPDDLMPQKGFCIHHSNGNKLDDSENNIKKWTRLEHGQFHMNGNQIGKGNQNAKGHVYQPTEEQNARKSEAMKGNQNGKGNKGKKHRW